MHKTGKQLLYALFISAVLSSPASAEFQKLPVPQQCMGKLQKLNLYQRNHPMKFAPYSAVDLYCNRKGKPALVAKSVTLCDSNYIRDEQKMITIAVAPAKAAQKAAQCKIEDELKLVPHGTKPE